MRWWNWWDYASAGALALFSVGLVGLIVYGCQQHAEVAARCREHGEEPMTMYKGPTLCVRPDGTMVRR